MSCSSQKESKVNTKIVKGVIIYESEPLRGPYIQVKDTKRATMADIDGKFEITVKENNKLTISFIGYDSKEIKITDTYYYEIYLEETKRIQSRGEKRMIKRYIKTWLL